MSFEGFHLLLRSLSGWVWHNSLAASVLVALVLLGHLLFRKWLPPRWQYALWLLAALRLVTPIVPSSTLSIFNLSNTFKPTPATPTELPIVPSSTPLLPEQTIVALQVAVSTPAPLVHVDSPTVSRTSHNSGLTPVLKKLETNRLLDCFVPLLPYIWLLGALTYFIAAVWQHRRMASWIRRQTPVTEPGILNLLKRCKTELGVNRHIQLIATSTLTIPALFGLFKIRLLLPKPMLERTQELRPVLLHELAHARRGDVLQNWLLILVQALHWFNPAVWLALRRLRAERELVCDAMVLSRLDPTEQHAYGTTLLKLCEQISKPLLAPSLVPVINHKNQIRRRIIMIAQYKPTPRFITLGSALLVATLATLTFSGAAERENKATADKPKPESEARQKTDRETRTLEVLQKELDIQYAKIKQKQNELDELRLKLGMVNESETLDPEMLRRLEAMRIEAQAEYQRISTLYSSLKELKRSELNKAINTAVPDTLLIELLSRFTMAEMSYAEASEQYGADHPEVKRKKRVLDEVKRQVEERIDGILEGLKIKTAAAKAGVEQLTKEVDRTKINDIESAIRRRPYFQLKRELETLQTMQERLQLRLMQERIDAMLSPSNDPVKP